MTDLVLAAALICTPPGPVEPVPPPELWLTLRPAVRRLAVDWELADDRELRYLANRREDFPGDIDTLRRRHADLSDAPPVADHLRFPPRETVNELVRFNRAFRAHLEQRWELETDRRPLLEAAIRETDERYRVMDECRTAGCEFMYVTVRRQALKRMRDALGGRAYDCCELPYCVPLHRFNEVRWSP